MKHEKNGSGFWYIDFGYSPSSKHYNDRNNACEINCYDITGKISVFNAGLTVI